MISNNDPISNNVPLQQAITNCGQQTTDTTKLAKEAKTATIALKAMQHSYKATTGLKTLNKDITKLNDSINNMRTHVGSERLYENLDSDEDTPIIIRIAICLAKCFKKIFGGRTATITDAIEQFEISRESLKERKKEVNTLLDAKNSLINEYAQLNLSPDELKQELTKLTTDTEEEYVSTASSDIQMPQEQRTALNKAGCTIDELITSINEKKTEPEEAQDSH
jgi:hypothetical protein